MSQPRKEPTISTSINLPPGEAQFARAVALGASPHAAAIAAGYSGASAPYLLRKPRVQSVLRELADHLAALVRRVEAPQRNAMFLNKAGADLVVQLEANRQAAVAMLSDSKGA